MTMSRALRISSTMPPMRAPPPTSMCCESMFVDEEIITVNTEARLLRSSRWTQAAWSPTEGTILFMSFSVTRMSL